MQFSKPAQFAFTQVSENTREYCQNMYFISTLSLLLFITGLASANYGPADVSRCIQPEDLTYPGKPAYLTAVQDFCHRVTADVDKYQEIWPGEHWIEFLNVETMDGGKREMAFYISIDAKYKDMDSHRLYPQDCVKYLYDVLTPVEDLDWPTPWVRTGNWQGCWTLKKGVRFDPAVPVKTENQVLVVKDWHTERTYGEEGRKPVPMKFDVWPSRMLN